MDTAATVLAVAFAASCLIGAIGDFMRLPQIGEIMDRIGVSRRVIPLAGVAKTAGALGLLIGLRVEWLGIVAAVALTVYFVLATAAHLRVHDGAVNTAPAAGMLVLAFATLVTALA